MRWPDFERSIGKAFQELREGKELFDVTLACKDGKLEAHKVILSSCSPVLKDIIKDNVPLIYIKDVKIPQLQAVLDFMYQGKVDVDEKELEAFLALAKEWQVKGLNPDELPSESCVKEAVTENRLRFRKPGHLFKSTVLVEERVKIAAGKSSKEVEGNYLLEELEKLKEDKGELMEMVQSLKTAKKQMEDKVAAITLDLETLKQTSARSQQEQQNELQTKRMELLTLQKKVDDMEKIPAKMANAMKEKMIKRFEMERNERVKEMEELKKANHFIVCLNEANNAKAGEIEVLKSQLAQKDEEIAQKFRKFREQEAEKRREAEKKVVALESLLGDRNGNLDMVDKEMKKRSRWGPPTHI